MGAFQGAMIGSGVGLAIDPPAGPDGPRLDDLKIQMSTYGAPIPFEWGCNRHAGTIIWPRDLTAVEHQHVESTKGGVENNVFTYSLSFAVLIAEGPITGVRRIWANKKLIYDISGDGDLTISDPVIGIVRFYLGTESQETDPLIEATDGPSPAYLGYAYAVFEDYDVSDLWGRPPQLEFEVIQNGVADFSPELTLLDEVPEGTGGMANYQSCYDPDRGTLWVHNGTHLSIAADTGGAEDHSCLNVYDLMERTRLAIVSPGEDRDYGDLIYDVSRRFVYAGGEYTDSFGATDTNGANRFDPDSYALTGVLRSAVLPGMEFPIRPGRMGRLGGNTPNDSLGYLLASSSSHAISGMCLWMPETAVFEDTDDIEGWWKDQIIGCQSNVMALITGGSAGGVLLLDALLPFMEFTLGYPKFHPRSEFDDLVPRYMAEDSLRERLIVCAGTKAYILDMTTDVVTEFYDTGNFDIVSCAVYDDRSDRIYLVSSGAGFGKRITAIGSDSLSVENYFDIGAMGETPREILLSPARGEIVLVGPTSVWLLNGMYATLESDAVPVSSIVSDICVRAGLTTGDIDVSQLTATVDGYIVPRQMTARSAIEPLQIAFSFDAVESDDKIKFVPRAAEVVTEIPQDDRAAHEFGGDMPEPLTISVAFELEIPFQVDVEYPDVDADHLIGTQYERRLTKASRQKLTVPLAVVMTAEKAKEIARVLLYESWLNKSFGWTSSRKYAHLEPTDVVSLPTASATYQAKIKSKREQPNGVIEWEASVVALEVYDQTGQGYTPTDYVPQTIYDPGQTLLKLLDIPMVRDDDDNAGFYVAMAGDEPGWMGAQLFRSNDGGSNYEAVFAMSNEAAIGRTSTALPDFTAGNIFDEGSTVDVFMSSGLALVSVTQDQVLNGYNKAVIGAHGRWEVVHFKNAELIAADTYRLSGFLRGCRGTEWATGTHLVADSFVLASASSWNRINASDTGLERRYKAPPVRIRLDAVDAVDFTNSSVALKPFAPVDMVGVRDGGNDLTITWARRTRLAAGTLHLPVLLGEATESYSIDIVVADAVVRTITSTTQTAEYLASEQTADGITPGDPVTVRVYQISAAVGRGYQLEKTL